jgi:hypothetical protein
MSTNVNGDLTRNQARGIAALLANRRIDDAAQSVGLNERTLIRWMKEPVFSRALQAAETAAIGFAVRSLISDLRANHETMREIRDDTDLGARVRLSAAQSLDMSLLRWRDLQNSDERITKLEMAVFDGTKN